jgi:hypothetical protein
MPTCPPSVRVNCLGRRCCIQTNVVLDALEFGGPTRLELHLIVDVDLAADKALDLHVRLRLNLDGHLPIHLCLHFTSISPESDMSLHRV